MVNRLCPNTQVVRMQPMFVTRQKAIKIDERIHSADAENEESIAKFLKPTPKNFFQQHHLPSIRWELSSFLRRMSKKVSITTSKVIIIDCVGRSLGDPLNTTGVTMPAKGNNPALTDEDLSNIVAYLRTLR